ncbi:hypothetical protein O181_032053 [Austropuccinia psidii MF-1]|uniref:Uncharacterized protein n=1 Tax=Austropuccinia psidii MF-1 TaxID=1389203 RepID=A0A9Q3H564_9BASI|nr:hypothetical protein [Austropuccinia psidii MF-1]
MSVLTHPYALAPLPHPHDFPPMLPPHFRPHPSLHFCTPAAYHAYAPAPTSRYVHLSLHFHTPTSSSPQVTMIMLPH